MAALVPKFDNMIQLQHQQNYLNLIGEVADAMYDYIYKENV